MRTKEEAEKIADRLFKMKVIHEEYSDCKRIYAFNYLLCRINSIIYIDIRKAIRKVLEDKKTIDYVGEYNKGYIRIYYGTKKDEKEKQELKDALKELLDKEE